jgi:thiamine-monophosphate kinase
MIDLSDGLSSDLWHICESSNVGARLSQKALPLSDELKNMSEINGLDPYDLALSGGEDYRLLITVPEENMDRFQKMFEKSNSCPIFCVGKITADDGMEIIRPDGMKDRLDATGFDHFLPPSFLKKP